MQQVTSALTLQKWIVVPIRASADVNRCIHLITVEHPSRQMDTTIYASADVWEHKIPVGADFSEKKKILICADFWEISLASTATHARHHENSQKTVIELI